MRSWAERVEAVWGEDALTDEDRIVRIDQLAAERPPGDPLALLEQAGARDSAGREMEAEPLYRAALEAGLSGEHRTRAIIQLASTIRNLGRIDEAIELLRDAYQRGGESALHDETAAFYALALVSKGDAAAGAAVALKALAPHLTSYARSVAAYADELTGPD